MPFMLVMSPIVFAILLTADPSDEPISAWTVFVLFAFPVVSFAISFWYCRNHFGWFGGKKTAPLSTEEALAEAFEKINRK